MQKEKRLKIEKKKKEAEERLKEKGRKMSRGQEKITEWMTKPVAMKRPKVEKKGVG